MGRVFVGPEIHLAPPSERDLLANDLTDSFEFGQRPIEPLVLPTRECGPAPADVALDPAFHPGAR